MHPTDKTARHVSRPQSEPEHFAEARINRVKEARKRRTGKWKSLGNCSTKCKLNPMNLENFKSSFDNMMERGDTDREISAILTDAGYAVSHRAVGSHRKFHTFKAEWHEDNPARHGTGRDRKEIEEEIAEAAEPVDNIEALRRIIAVGMKKVHTGKITPELVVKAIDLEERLTRGTKQSALEQAMATAFDELDEDDEDGESPMDAAARLAEEGSDVEPH